MGSVSWISSNSVNAASFATKPISGGRPDIDAAATTVITVRRGNSRPTPLSRRKSRVPVA